MYSEVSNFFSGRRNTDTCQQQAFLDEAHKIEFNIQPQLMPSMLDEELDGDL